MIFFYRSSSLVLLTITGVIGQIIFLLHVLTVIRSWIRRQMNYHSALILRALQKAQWIEELETSLQSGPATSWHSDLGLLFLKMQALWRQDCFYTAVSLVPVLCSISSFWMDRWMCGTRLWLIFQIIWKLGLKTIS